MTGWMLGDCSVQVIPSIMAPPSVGLAGTSASVTTPLRNRSYSGQQGSPAAPPRELEKRGPTFFFRRGPLLLSSHWKSRLLFADASPALPSIPLPLSILQPSTHQSSAFTNFSNQTRNGFICVPYYLQPQSRSIQTLACCLPSSPTSNHPSCTDGHSLTRPGSFDIHLDIW